MATDENPFTSNVQYVKKGTVFVEPRLVTDVEYTERTTEGILRHPSYKGERIDKTPLEQPEAIAISLQIASGLAAAHDAGIVHRDLKPSNIIFTKQGLVKIIDFGVAKVDGSSRLTESGTRIGTVSYMSPEQAMGEQADLRTDLWSLGVLLFEMITGEAPFRGEVRLMVGAICGLTVICIEVEIEVAEVLSVTCADKL